MLWTGGAGLCTWLERWDLPSCWMALSADQGSSMVRCTRLRWLTAAAEACREMPVLAASDTMATSFSPLMNAATQHTRPITYAAEISAWKAKQNFGLVVL